MEETLDRSFRLLDVCGATKDVFLQMKECMQEQQLSLWSKRGGGSSMENAIGAYMTSRRRYKVVSKCFGELKRMEKNCTMLSSNKDSNMAAVFRLLKEVKEIGLIVFESLLSFVSRPKARSGSIGWSIVSTLLPSRHVSSEGQVDANEIEKIDAELFALISKKSSLVKVQNVLKGLEALASSIQKVEEELESVCRHLLKTRVSFPNIFNH